jgi:tetratricopeptide (TPR) repeat protein
MMAKGRLARILISMGILVCVQVCLAGESTWIEVRSPHFVVISDASAKQARRTARSLEQFRNLIQTALPKLKVDSSSPLIACVLRDEKGFKALLPNEMLGKGAATPGGLFAASPEKSFVLLRADAPPELGYHAIYHEYVHQVMRLNYPDLPLWLSEGFAEFFGSANLSDGASDLGIASPNLLLTLQNSTMLPLATLLSVTQDSPHYRRQGMVEVFYAQSWALTHYLMLGDKQAHTAQLFEFLDLLQKDIPEQEAIQRAFGDLKALEQKLGVYIRSMAFYHYRIAAKLDVKEDQYPVRTLSPAESLALRGEILVHVNRFDDAKALLKQSLELDPRSALANEGMGMLYNNLQDSVQAEKYFSAAAELDSKSFLAQYFAAHAAFERGERELVEGYLRKALTINPDFAPACRNLSEHLTTQRDRLPEALELARKAASLEPANLSHRIHIGIVLLAMGKEDEASALAERILAIAKTDGDRRGAESLRFQIKERRENMLENQRRAATVKEELQRMEDRRLRDEKLEEQIQTQAEQRKQAAKAAPIKTGAAVKAAGIIRSVKCDYPAVMDVVLDSNGKLQKLRASNYYQVQYWAVEAPGKTGFEPCEELEGKRVEIEFLTVSGQEYSGLIKTVAIVK